MTRTPFVSILAAAVITLLPSVASAQSFPGEASWVALPCKGSVMVDNHRDQSGAVGERDIVGDGANPAGMRARDDQFLYLRMRLDADAAASAGAGLRPFGWGFAIDIDKNLTTYEILILTSGNNNLVSVYKNATTTAPDDPTDPADEPPVATFPVSSHARTVVAQGSSYGGNPDYFLEVAVPWSTLAPLGLTPSTPIVVWAATSSNPSSLNADFACHDGASGAPKLSSIAADPTTADPNVDSDGDGWTDAQETQAGTNPRDPKSFPQSVPPGTVPAGSASDLELVGNGPCGFGSTRGAGAASLAWTVLGVAALWRRARRS